MPDRPYSSSISGERPDEVERIARVTNGAAHAGGPTFTPYFDALSGRMVTDEDREEPLSDIEVALDSCVEYLCRFIEFDGPHQPRVVALWALYTHIVFLDPPTFDHMPYLLVSSAERGSGKTTLMDLLGCIVHEPYTCAGASAAVLIREVGGKTVLYDEFDTVFTDTATDESTATMRLVFNTGFKRGGVIQRFNAKSNKAEGFPSFGPKALFGIGRSVPDTIRDRSLDIRLQRKAPNVSLEKARDRVIRPAGGTVADLFRIVAPGIAKRLAPLDPESLPAFLNGRAMDIWEPLVAIARRASPRWEEYVHEAMDLMRPDEDDETLNVRLLRDIRLVLDDMGVDDIPTKVLIGKPTDTFMGVEVEATGLCAIEEAPWSESNRGKPITPRGLAHRLSGFGIKPERLWNGITGGGSRTTMGYRREAFREPWRRYLRSPEEEQGEDAV